MDTRLTREQVAARRDPRQVRHRRDRARRPGGQQALDAPAVKMRPLTLSSHRGSHSPVSIHGGDHSERCGVRIQLYGSVCLEDTLQLPTSDGRGSVSVSSCLWLFFASDVGSVYVNSERVDDELVQASATHRWRVTPTHACTCGHTTQQHTHARTHARTRTHTHTHTHTHTAVTP